MADSSERSLNKASNFNSDFEAFHMDTSRNNEQKKKDERLYEDNNHPDNDDDDESECWDDAKALLNNDDEEDFVDSHEFDSVDGVTTTAAASTEATPSLRHPASSSSAYSSLQSTSIHPPTTASLTAPALSASSSPADDLILHKAVFNNDEKQIMAILQDHEFLKQSGLVNKRDMHGNTALHLACMMGRSIEIIKTLLHDDTNLRWSIDARNLQRWTPFHEACSYGNRDVISLLANQLKGEVEDVLHNNKLSKFLERTKDYRLVLKWEFQSWVPFVSRVLPSDVCVIIKHGKSIRIDTRLLDYEGLFKKKGESCLVYSNNKWIIINNRTKKYQYFDSPNVYKNLDDKMDEFMSTDIIDFELKSSEMQLTRSTSGWIWKAEKTGKVGRFNAALYDFTNIFLITKKRREHLSEEDLKRNKSAYKSAVHAFKFGEKSTAELEQPHEEEEEEGEVNETSGKEHNNEANNDDSQKNEQETGDDDVIHRESLPPPPPTTVTWQEYIEAPPGQHPNVGREQKCKINKLAVKASVAMSEEFPLSKKDFLDLLSIVPIKIFKKLKDFVELKLPDGFPVRLDIPIFPFLTARITFEDFAFLEENAIDQSIFAIPQDFEQNAV